MKTPLRFFMHLMMGSPILKKKSVMHGLSPDYHSLYRQDDAKEGYIQFCTEQHKKEKAIILTEKGQNTPTAF